MLQQIFFQSSMPRSGSTLFQNIIAQNPDFYATPTDGTLELLYAARQNYTDSPEFRAQDSELMLKGFAGFCRDGLLGFYQNITDKPYVMCKSRGWGIHRDFLHSFYPNPKIIVLVRDLRDILASMEKKFRGNPTKADNVLDWSRMQGTTTPKRVDQWLSTPPVGLAFERLSEMARQGIDRHCLFIKYEDLVMHPQTTMTMLYEYLGVKHFKHDFDNVEQVTKEDDEVYGIYGDHVIRHRIEWRKSDAEKVLGRDVCKWIKDNPAFEWYNSKFGYR